MRLLLLALPVLVASARPADACTAPYCTSGEFVPRDGATVPANAPGFYYRPGTGHLPGEMPYVQLTAASDPSTTLAFTSMPQPNGDFVLVPDAPLVAGELYTLAEMDGCNGTSRSTFTAGPAAPLPSSLGMLQLIGHGSFAQLDIATDAGSCSVKIDATVAFVELVASASATPWADLLLYETLVDDKPWVPRASNNVFSRAGESWVGRGRDLMYRMCKPNPQAGYPGLEVGGHMVRFRASLPGATTASLATPTQAIELMCVPGPDEEDPPGSDDDGGGCSSSRPATLGFVLFVLGILVRRWR